MSSVERETNGVNHEVSLPKDKERYVSEVAEGEGLFRFRSLRGATGLFQKVLLVAIPVTGVLFTLDVHTMLRFSFWKEQYIGIFLALVLASIYLGTPPTKKGSRYSVPWYDCLLIVASLVVGLYLAVNYPAAFGQAKVVGYYTPELIALATLLILLTLEALRRLFGWVMTGLLAFFLFYGVFTYLFPGLLYGKGEPWTRLSGYLYMDPNSFMYLVGIAATIIVSFILFGEIMFGFGGGKVLIDLSLGLIGRFTGGPAKATVVASGLFGLISGSATANLLVTGSVTIPMMKRLGYKSHVAGAVASVASSGGMIMPPVMGITAFIMADVIGVPYSQVALAAFIPASLYYIALFIQVHLEADKIGLRGLPPGEIPPLRPALRRLWLVILPFAFLVYTLFILRMYPATSAVYTTFFALVLILILKENRTNFWRRLLTILEETGRLTVTVGMLLTAAGFIIAIIGVTGLGFRLSLSLVQLGGGNVFLLLIVAAATCILLGMGTDIIASYLLVAILVAPALVELGIPIMASHLFCLYFGNFAMISPPIGVIFYIAAGLAHSKPMATGWSAMRLSVLAFIVPFLFVYNQGLLLNGEIWRIALDVVIAILGTFVFGIALVGYLSRNIPLLNRILLGLGAAALFVSVTVILVPWGIVLKLVGIIIAVPLIWMEWRQRERQALPVRSY